MQHKISEGGYGKVYKGLWNKIPVAIKQYIKPEDFSKNDYLDIMQKELQTLSEMSFPDVI